MTPSDLFLSPDLTEAEARAYLASLGFRDVAAVDEHLQKIADDLVVREALGRLAPDLISSLLESPDPDAAAIGVAQYVGARAGRAMLIDYLREDPRALHVLTHVMGASPLLSEILVRTPEYFHWLVSQVERSAPDRQDHEEELVSALASLDDPVDALMLLRRWKRRETLRIGTRDLLQHETVQTVAAQLSDVACVVVDFALAIVMRERLDSGRRSHIPGTFAVVATGKLGGRELAYAPDLDLLYVYDVAPADVAAGEAPKFFVEVAERLNAALADEAGEGPLYRVTTPGWMRTHGGLAAYSLEEYRACFDSTADVGVRLQLTRARPIAGDAGLGARFMDACRPFVYHGDGRGAAPADAGADLETFTRSCQLVHGADHASLREGGTLEILAALKSAGLMSEPVCTELDRAYVFLRGAEHRRQLGLVEDIDHQISASRARVESLVRGIRL